VALSLKAILGLDGSGFQLGIKQAQSAANKFSKTLDSEFGSRLKTLLGAAAVEEAARHTLDFAGHVNDLSLRLGISTDAVQQWDNALKQSGSSIETAASFFDKLAIAREKALGGDGKTMGAFKKLGVSQSDLQSKRVEDIGLQIGEAVKNGDPQAMISSLREVGGKGAGELIAAFKAGLKDMFDSTPLISAEDIVELDSIGDKFTVLGKTIMAAMAPVLAFINRRLTDMKALLDIMFGSGAAALGALAGGSSFKDAIQAGRDASNAAFSKWQADKKANSEAADAARNPKKKTPEIDDDKAEKVRQKLREQAEEMSKRDAEKHRKEDAALSKSDTHLNSLQQMGALASFNPVQDSFAKLTRALDRNSAITERNNKIDEDRGRRTADNPMGGMTGGANNGDPVIY
jgi:hypothetical protein